MSFYAVLKGRIPGIYTNWNECKKQTEGFSGPVFRKFSSKEEAEKFIGTLSSSPTKTFLEKPKKKYLIDFVKSSFHMVIKLFKMSEENIEKIAQSMWDDMENADRNDPEVFRNVLEVYLPLPDFLYQKDFSKFLNIQSKNKDGYGRCIEKFRIAYLKDGGKSIDEKKFGGNPLRENSSSVEIFFDDEFDDETDVENSHQCFTSIIYTDGGHNKSTGDEAWGSVVNKNGKDLLDEYKHLFTDMTTRIENLPVGARRIIISKFNDVISQQNNGAELLALVAGLRIALFKKDVGVIRCDSDLMIKYWSKNLKDSTREKMDPLKSKYIDELIKLRKEFEKIGGVIEKISGDDNLADLGFHK